MFEIPVWIPLSRRILLINTDNNHFVNVESTPTSVKRIKGFEKGKPRTT